MAVLRAYSIRVAWREKNGAARDSDRKLDMIAKRWLVPYEKFRSCATWYTCILVGLLCNAGNLASIVMLPVSATARVWKLMGMKVQALGK